MHIRRTYVSVRRRSIWYRTEPGQPISGQIQLQWINGCQNDVDAQVELEPVKQEWRRDILLDDVSAVPENVVLGVLDEIDAVPLGPSVWFDDEDGVIVRRVLVTDSGPEAGREVGELLREEPGTRVEGVFIREERSDQVQRST